MDGSSRTDLVTENVMWPNAITLDLVSERLYWADAKLHLIGSVGLDGSRPNIISEPNWALHHPFSVSVFEDWVYWSEWGQNGSSIFKANKFDGSDLGQVTEAALQQKPMFVSVWHAYRQPGSPSLCRDRTIQCSHLCVPAPVIPHQAGVVRPPKTPQTVCLCPRDHSLGEDKATCHRDEDSVTVVTKLLQEIEASLYQRVSQQFHSNEGVQSLMWSQSRRSFCHPSTLVNRESTGRPVINQAGRWQILLKEVLEEDF